MLTATGLLLLVLTVGAWIIVKLRRWAMREMGPSYHCPKCGYSRRDLLTDRCPECGLLLAEAQADHDRRTDHVVWFWLLTICFAVIGGPMLAVVLYGILRRWP